MYASGSLGVPKIKISAVDLSRVRSGSLLIPFNQRSLLRQRPVKYLSLRTTFGSVKAVQVTTVPTAETSGTVISICFLIFRSIFYGRYMLIFGYFTIYMFCTSSVFTGGLIYAWKVSFVFPLNVF